MNEYFWHDIAGVLGVFLVLLCYFLLQINKMQGSSLSYSVLNGLGACFILVSLYYDFNLSAFIVEVAWVLISLYGIYKYLGRSNPGASTIDPTSGEDL